MSIDCHSHSYTVSVKTDNEDNAHYVETNRQGTGFLLAAEDSSFCLLLKNNSTERCDASVTIGKTYVGTWRINADHHVLIEQTDKRRMCFDRATFYDAAAKMKHVEVKDNSSITVVFLPICATKHLCAPVEQADGSTSIVCHADIAWQKLVTVSLPVLLRKVR